jgi:hypothetical protein
MAFCDDAAGVERRSQAVLLEKIFCPLFGPFRDSSDRAIVRAWHARRPSLTARAALERPIPVTREGTAQAPESSAQRPGKALKWRFT